MNKFSTFVFGLIVGAGLLFVGMRYHIIRASDGYHWVPKSNGRLTSIYSDVREFTVEDWQQRKDLIVDITNSGDTALQEEAAKSALGNTFDSAWDSWAGKNP